MAISGNKRRVLGKGCLPLSGDSESKMQNLLDEAEQILRVWKKKTRIYYYY